MGIAQSLFTGLDHGLLDVLKDAFDVGFKLFGARTHFWSIKSFDKLKKQKYLYASMQSNSQLKIHNLNFISNKKKKNKLLQQYFQT